MHFGLHFVLRQLVDASNIDKVVWLGGYALSSHPWLYCGHCSPPHGPMFVLRRICLWTMPLEGLGFDVHVVIIIILDPHGQPWSGAR